LEELFPYLTIWKLHSI